VAFRIKFFVNRRIRHLSFCPSGTKFAAFFASGIDRRFNYSPVSERITLHLVNMLIIKVPPTSAPDGIICMMNRLAASRNGFDFGRTEMEGARRIFNVRRSFSR
jgi:hypothetical protein